VTETHEKSLRKRIKIIYENARTCQCLLIGKLHVRILGKSFY